MKTNKKIAIVALLFAFIGIATAQISLKAGNGISISSDETGITIINTQPTLLELCTPSIAFPDRIAYYFSSTCAASTTSFNTLILSPINGTVTKVVIAFTQISGVLPSNESIVFSLCKNLSVTPCTQLGSGPLIYNDPNNPGFDRPIATYTFDTNIAIDTDDSFELLLEAPTWATNPGNHRISGYVYIS